MITINHPLLEKYIDSSATEEISYLKELRAETIKKAPMSQMLCSHSQGLLLSLLSLIKNPSSILEIGTYTGYSALCLAQGLQANGSLITIDKDTNTQAIAKNFFQKANFIHKITSLIGVASEIIATLNKTFDIIFIDADKVNYSLYYDLVFQKLTKGGIILVDNVLWRGKVIEDTQINLKDSQAIAISNFNKKVVKDNRVLCSIIPIRDGLMMIYKK